MTAQIIKMNGRVSRGLNTLPSEGCHSRERRSLFLTEP
jgi:hypothetical protein